MGILSLFIFRYRVFFLLALFLGWTGIVIAQEPGIENPTEQKIVSVLLKIVLPFLWTVVSPWLSGLIIAGVKFIPQNLQYVITGMIGAGFGSLTGMLDEFPLHVDSAAEMGGSSAVAAQIAANSHRSSFNPVIVKETPK